MEKGTGETQYEKLAACYDELMYDVSYEEWASYIVSFIDGRETHILEYACGTGNITLQLTKRGHSVVAVDASQEMLEAAEQKLRGRAADVGLVCADMADFRMGKPVECAVCACDGVNYILETPRLERFFANVHRNLEPGGKFLFDVSSAHKIAIRLGNEFYYDDGDMQTVFWSNRYNETDKTVEMELTLFVRAGDVYKRYDETHRQRAWRIKELTQALVDAGFAIEGVYAFGTRDAAVENDERIQFVAVKESTAV